MPSTKAKFSKISKTIYMPKHTYGDAPLYKGIAKLRVSKPTFSTKKGTIKCKKRKI